MLQWVDYVLHNIATVLQLNESVQSLIQINVY